MAERLPIYALEEELRSRLQKHRRVLIAAPTGSGKSTQVPQMLVDNGLAESQVIILQPRRLATRLLAARVARERRTELGGEVGYQIRFENVTSPKTRIKFVTEGVLLRQMVRDPMLEGVSALIFDEFHERHLYGDITLARALELQEAERPELKILVMSATLDLERLEEYLKPCEVLQTHGRMFPVEIQYAAKAAYLERRPSWEQAAAAFAQYAPTADGDVLIFMPGSFEIERTLEAIRRRPESKGWVLLPLHGELSPRQQDAAVAQYPERKVVVATNVAETSLTIEGIRCVIDSGLARIPRFDAHRGINTLLVEKVSQAATEQRAGRAGRTAPGVCIRLWSAEEQRHRPAQEMPEIKRLDLSEVVLTLKAAGITDLHRFRWLEAPEKRALARAEELLADLGAISGGENDGSVTRHGSSEDGSSDTRHPSRVTAVGRKMLAFPVHPRYARMLLAAQEFGCVTEACLVAALTQGRELLVRKAAPEIAQRRNQLFGEDSQSDFRTLMSAWQYAADHKFDERTCRDAGINATAARQVGPLREQFLDIARQEGLESSRGKAPEEALQKCILIGFSDRVARRLEPGSLRCDLVHGRRGTLSRESVVRDGELLVAAEVSEIAGREAGVVDTVLSLATAVKEEWLNELFPEDIDRAPRVYYEPGTKRVCAEEQLRFRGLAIARRRVEPPPAEAAAKLLAKEVVEGRLGLEDWDEWVEQWILRLNLLRQWCPELELPALGAAERQYLVEQLCHGAFSYKEIKNRPVKETVKNWLSTAQQSWVEQHTPERVGLPGGRSTKVVYDAERPPCIAARIQQLYGMNSTPRIAMGRVPVVVNILAPNMRPVQITQDLPGFWREHYPKIKRELQRKYPKHEWR